MSKSGQNNQKGVDAQNWAALALFLQYVKDPSFVYIKLEPEESEDFDLVFGNGNKIICESKYRNRKFSYPDMKELLEKVIKRKNFESQDEILVVCKNTDKNLSSEIKNIRYFPQLSKKFKDKGFSKSEIELLPKVNFWILEKGFDYNNYNYTLISEMLNFWMPAESVIEFTDSTLYNKITKKSISGLTYAKLDFEKDLAELKKRIQDSGDMFNTKVVSMEKQFTKLEKDTKRSIGIKLGTSSLSTLSTRWDLMTFATDRLKKRSDLDLEKWDNLWQLNNVRGFSYSIFTIFEQNLNSTKNIKYLIGYFKKYSGETKGFHKLDFFDINILKIISKILEISGEEYLNDCFDILKNILLYNDDKFAYNKKQLNNLGEWEKGEVCKFLLKVYKLGKASLREKVFSLIVSEFNLIDDTGEFSHYSPRTVFEIIYTWLNEDFEKRFKKIVEVIVKQYNEYYKKFNGSRKFDGMEYVGGGISSMGDTNGTSYYISEHHFVSFVLTPAILEYYKKDSKAGWDFIVKNCLSRTEDKIYSDVIKEKVSAKRPDFLNRSVYEIILNRYNDSNKFTSDEAYLILKEFILLKGIPVKYDYIYYSLLNSNMSDDKRWKLTSLTIDKYNMPVNTFVEQIVSDLAVGGHKESIETLKKWYANPKYFENFYFERQSTINLKKILEINTELAIELFKNYILNNTNKKNGANFSAYSYATLLRDILKQDYKKGLSIIRSIESLKKLTESQQIIYTFSLFEYPGNDDSDDKDLLMKLYKDVVDPFLKKNDDNVVKIIKRLSNTNSREAFVQLATRLAVKKEIAKALRIVRIFINDPDPLLPNKKTVKDNKYNEHQHILNGEDPKSITSIRGWCGWTLMKCNVLDGRDYIPEIIALTKKLLNDENYYVIHMGTFSLSQLAKNRLTVLPSDKDILFFNDKVKTALEMSKEIESMAFELLDKFSRWTEKVQTAMMASIIHPFDNIRILNEKDAYKFVEVISKLPSEIIQESAPLLIFFAEYRKNNYQNWKFKESGLYDDLLPEQYNDARFKLKLIEIIENVQSVNPDFCFRFASSIDQVLRNDIGEDLQTKESNIIIALKYLNIIVKKYSHNIYSLIYRLIKDRLSVSDKYVQQWYSLLLLCFTIESNFYSEQAAKNNLREVYWYPSIYHSEILELIFDKMSTAKFIELSKIYFSFPNGIEINETMELVSKLEILSKEGNEEASKIIYSLVDRNKSKYWHLRKGA